ncbi:MAG TPA: hypothetical protein VIF81_12645 [Pyrinomonadaceae bacterium]
MKNRATAALKLLGSFFLAITAVVAFASATVVLAQSTDQSLPTPVFSNEINGTIAALDIGDPRLTRHFYAFEATPGDLSVIVNSRNLNGDVDVFTAVTFRPLLKISIYANTFPPEVTKGLYFRSRQILILRVEARTPNDDPGTYRITFGGSFQPFSGGIPVAENTESTSETTASERKTKRLSSVGATIEQPAEAKAEEVKAPETVAEPTKEEAAKEGKSKPRSTRSTSRGTARNRPPKTPRPKHKPTEKAKTESGKTELPKTEPPETQPVETKPIESEKKPDETTTTAKPPAQQPVGPHLIIERTDGTRIDRPMSTVRRVIVESNVIVVVLKTGRIERIPMSSVARMAIEP